MKTVTTQLGARHLVYARWKGVEPQTHKTLLILTVRTSPRILFQGISEFNIFTWLLSIQPTKLAFILKFFNNHSFSYFLQMLLLFLNMIINTGSTIGLTRVEVSHLVVDMLMKIVYVHMCIGEYGRLIDYY